MRHNSQIGAIVERATTRARIIVAGEAAALGAAVAAWSIPIGFLVSLAFAIWRSRRSSRAAVLKVLERADARASNVIVTADEIAAGALDAKPAIRERVEADALGVVASINIARLFPITVLAVLTAAAAAAWAASGAIRRHNPWPAAANMSPGTQPPAAAIRPGLQVTVRLDPPAYTHLAPSVAVDPAQIQTVEHATVRLTIEASSASAAVDITGDRRELARSPTGSFEYGLTAVRSGYVLVTTGDGARRMMPLSVRPDALPAVKITSPARDLVYEGGNPRIAFGAAASDDFGLRALTLQFTKVSGSGEQFSFSDGAIPLTIDRRSEREWVASASRTLGDLALAEGDMLVYRAVAVDIRPGGGETSSDAFFIEVSKLGVAAGDAFTLPEQETRYALSQQMLIVKTDRLNQRRGSMAASEFEEAAQSLAVEQRMIRSEFVFMLGGEIEDEEVEAEQSVEIQAGRLANRGQRDIRAATVAMSQAEKQLTAANTAEALKAERAAVEALQRAFARDRYILRALGSRTQLDLTRRLTGSINDVLGWRRRLADAPANRAAIALQSVIQGIGAADTRQQIEVLAEFAVRSAPESAPLRSVAADLQTLADAWSTLPSADRSRRLDAIAEKLVAEARRVMADAPVTFGGPR